MCRKLHCPVIGEHEEPETVKIRNAHVVIRKSGSDALSTLEEGKVGEAMSRQASCQTATASAGATKS